MSARKEFTTAKGTKLPLLNLKGKEYLQVQHRLVWFEEENQSYIINTQPVQLTENHAVFRTEIRIMDTEGKVLRQATATKFEDKKGFPDFIEKAESGSIGRCLLALGYGTAFAGDELEEGQRLADAPISPATKSSVESASSTPEQQAQEERPAPSFSRTLKAKKTSSVSDMGDL